MYNIKVKIMKKLLKKIQFISLYATIGELIIIGIFFGLYIGNVSNLQELIQPDILGYITLAIILINLILLWGALFVVYFYRQKNDLQTGDILGSDTQASYKFADIGFILVDQDNIVIYVSETLKEKGFNILNHNIYSWCPELTDIDKDKKDNKDIYVINDRYFKITHLVENNVFILKDINDYETAFRTFENNATCIGIIMIDNYSDIVQNNEEINEIIPTIKTIINEYGKKYKLVLRSYKSDSYFVICRHENLIQMKNEGFSLLSSVRAVAKKSEFSTSLSIGFAYDFVTLTQLNEMASNALSIAISRGGDQVVIAQLNHELLFIGGKTEASESRNKVKVKADSNALLNYIEENDNILIMGHTDMDMDALGSCLGLQVLCDYKHKNSKIIYEPNKTEKKTRGAIQTEFTPEEVKSKFISIDNALKQANGSTLLLISDVNNSKNFMCEDIVDKTDKIIIVDHHRRGDNFIDNLIFSIIDTSASSASEIVVEIIKYVSKYPPIKMSSKIATIMLSGIYLDTNFFKSKTVGTRTFESCALLKNYGADSQEADSLLKDEFEEYSAVNSLVGNLKTYSYGITYCVGNDDEIYDRSTLAKACNTCINLKEISASFVIGRIGSDRVQISLRSDGSVNVQLIAEKLGGGGHFNSAAAQFSNVTTAKVEELLLNALDALKSEINVKGE